MCSNRPGGEATGSPSTRSAVVRNLGDQPCPRRAPLIPGRPTHPVQCSGSKADPDRLIDQVGRDPVHAGQGDLGGVFRSDRPEISSPMHYGRQLAGGQVEDDADAGFAQADVEVNGGGHDTPSD